MSGQIVSGLPLEIGGTLRPVAFLVVEVLMPHCLRCQAQLSEMRFVPGHDTDFPWIVVCPHCETPADRAARESK